MWTPFRRQCSLGKRPPAQSHGLGTNPAAEGKRGESRRATVDAGAAAVQGPQGLKKGKRPHSSPAGCAADGPAHCLYLLLIQSTSRWVIHPKALSSELLPLLKVKPVGFTGPIKRGSFCRSGASKVCPGDSWFYLGHEGQERSSMPSNRSGVLLVGGGRKQGFCQLRLSNPKTTTIRFLSSADIPSSAQTQPYSPIVPTLQTEALAHGPSLQPPLNYH